MTKRSAGITLILFSLVAGVVDRFSLVISSFLGEITCGDRYLQPVQGVVGDVSCGFNADMTLFLFLAVALIVGAILLTMR